MAIPYELPPRPWITNLLEVPIENMRPDIQRLHEYIELQEEEYALKAELKNLKSKKEK